MRTLLIMAVLAPLSAIYAAPVPAGDVVLSIDDDGEPIRAPWTLSTGGADAHLPPGLSIGGRGVADIAVYPQGILIFNAVGFDAGAPRPLDELLMESAIAPFWATLAPGVCGDVLAGAVERASGPSSLTIIWRDVPTAGCLEDAQRATFSVELSWDDAAVIRRLEFRYEVLPTETLEWEPRTGLRLPGAEGADVTFELLPDPDVGQLRGRAKLLLDGSSDGEPGAWIIELGDAAEIVGEREPDHLDENGLPRRPDGWREGDNCATYFNPLQEDFDGDGTGDVCDGDRDGDTIGNEHDNCPDVQNREQRDLDGDGRGDACDADMDGDVWPNWADLCPDVADAGNQDLDRDGLGDSCDPDPDADDPWAAVFRRWRPDMCPLIFDPLRMDRDADLVGDACDLRPDDPCVADCAGQRDSDGDGISDSRDTCSFVRDPAQRDFDGDGQGDACDGDADGDGVADVYQRCSWGLCEDPRASVITPMPMMVNPW